MPHEIERKYLVVGEFLSLAHARKHLVQGYLCSDPHRTVRIRLADNQAYITIKGGSDPTGLSRYEWEKEIDPADAAELLKLCQEGVIDKTRYLVRWGHHLIEVDEFHGENEGLLLAEVELQSADEEFTPPPFLGQEVTGDPRYYNSQLMRHPYRSW